MAFPGYTAEWLVATGATGTVWRAEQRDLARVVAIKELAPALLRTPGFLDRFRAEARTLADLVDPHVVRVYDYVETADRAYLVQEWVDGPTLGTVLQQHGRLTPEQALGVLRGALRGLAHAHRRGLVHRDLSPSNVLLDRSGTSKLVDFGLAVSAGDRDPALPAPSGTPAFAGPEADAGHPMTTRSDVYAAGALLYLLLSGTLPYGGDLAAVRRQHADAPVPRLTEVGPELADVVARAMAKDPLARPADATVLLAELEQAATARYGAAWASRSSVAGLVAVTAGTGAMAAAGSAALAGGGPAALVAPVTAVATAVTPSGLAPAAAQIGARVLGLPRLAVAVAGVVAVAAAAATAIVLTSGDDGAAPRQAADGQSAGPVAGEDSGGSSTGRSDPPTRPPLPTIEPVPVLSGTYDVAVTLTAKSGDVEAWPEVGSVETYSWTITATCPVGLCDASVVSSDGSTFTITYAGGTWTQDTSFVAECVDTVTRVPTGDTIPVAGSRTLVAPPAAGLDPRESLAGLSGTETISAPDPGCGSGGVDVSYGLALTRTGD